MAMMMIIWDKFGQAIGNLQAVEIFNICTHSPCDIDEVVPTRD
jgi:hypothetical protein